MQVDDEQAFTRFVKETEPRLSYALAAAYGPEVGADAAADALTYAWANWEKIRVMDNPAGYLYRVGQSRSRYYRRPRLLFPGVAPEDVHDIEPGLPGALDSLTRNQRMAYGVMACSREPTANRQLPLLPSSPRIQRHLHLRHTALLDRSNGTNDQHHADHLN